MNLDTLQFEIRETIDQLQRLAADIKSGRLKTGDVEELRVGLDHALEHICWAWNFRERSMEEIQALPGEEFYRQGRTVPNFLGDRILLDAEES